MQIGSREIFPQPRARPSMLCWRIRSSCSTTGRLELRCGRLRLALAVRRRAGLLVTDLRATMRGAVARALVEARARRCDYVAEAPVGAVSAHHRGSRGAGGPASLRYRRRALGRFSGAWGARRRKVHGKLTWVRKEGC